VQRYKEKTNSTQLLSVLVEMAEKTTIYYLLYKYKCLHNTKQHHQSDDQWCYVFFGGRM